MADRTYSTDEVAAIIARVAERQGSAPDGASTPGLTLTEVERACRDAGLDPALVRDAATDLDAGGLTLTPTSPNTWVAEYWADTPATPEGWEDAVDHLRVRFGSSIASYGPDEVSRRVGNGWEWTHQSGVKRTVSVSPRGGRTRVRVVTTGMGLADERIEGTGIGAFVAFVPGMLLGALLAETLAMGNLVGIAAVVLVVLLGAWIGATVLPPRTRKRRAERGREARALAEDVAGWVTAAAPESTTAPLAAPPAHEADGVPRLSLDLDAPVADDADVLRSSRRTRS